jgi:hypothetical protein
MESSGKKNEIEVRPPASSETKSQARYLEARLKKGNTTFWTNSTDTLLSIFDTGEGLCNAYLQLISHNLSNTFPFLPMWIIHPSQIFLGFLLNLLHSHLRNTSHKRDLWTSLCLYFISSPLEPELTDPG